MIESNLVNGNYVTEAASVCSSCCVEFQRVEIWHFARQSFILMQSDVE